MAARVPWAKTARQLAENMINPDILFTWPLVRVLVVFFDGFGGSVVSDSEALAAVNRRREAKGLQPLKSLPFRSTPRGK